MVSESVKEPAMSVIISFPGRFGSTLSSGACRTRMRSVRKEKAMIIEVITTLMTFDDHPAQILHVLEERLDDIAVSVLAELEELGQPGHGPERCRRMWRRERGKLPVGRGKTSNVER
jgi:hypothetical protein